LKYRSYIVVVNIGTNGVSAASVAVTDHENFPQLQNGSDCRHLFLGSLDIKHTAPAFVRELSELIGRHTLTPTQEAAK